MEAFVFGCICLLTLIPTYHGIALSIIAGGSFCKLQNGDSGTCTRVKSCEGAKRSDKGNSRDCLRWHTCCITDYKDKLLVKRARFLPDNGRGREIQNSRNSSSSPRPPSSQSQPSFAETSLPNLRIKGGSFCKLQNGDSGTCSRVKSCEGSKRSDKGNSRDCLKWHTCCITDYADKLLVKRAKFLPNNGRGREIQNSRNSSSSPRPPSSESQPSFAETSLPNLRIKGCGVRRILTDFIIGGRQAEFWPWMSAIFYRPQGSRTSRFQCGGTVISKRYILTAAHCVIEGGRPVSPARITIRMGGLTPQGDGRIYLISEIQLHDGYRSQMHYNDIALLTLAEDIESKNIVPACLPTTGMFNANFYKRNATVTGWGVVDSTASSMSTTLREAKVPVMSPSQCNRRYQRLAALSLPQGIIDSQICAGSADGTTDACQGDSGGPLVLEDRGKKWTLIGIVSFGLGCAEPEFPGVYTRVAKYLPWLLRHTDIPARNSS